MQQPQKCKHPFAVKMCVLCIYLILLKRIPLPFHSLQTRRPWTWINNYCSRTISKVITISDRTAARLSFPCKIFIAHHFFFFALLQSVSYVCHVIAHFLSTFFAYTSASFAGLQTVWYIAISIVNHELVPISTVNIRVLRFMQRLSN